MAKQLTSLTVFVSGPSDTDAEKSALRTVLTELSGVLEKTDGVTLRLVGWPETFRPGVASDTQSVINQQLSGEYDIYIGVLASRFGQPTPRAASGTEEEFTQALNRFRRKTTSVRLLFYFKRAAQDPFLLDLTQLEKVRNFRDSLGALGVLYQDFKDTAEFAEIVRKHLHHLIVDEWKDGQWNHVEIPAIVEDEGQMSMEAPDKVDTGGQLSETMQEEDEEPGLLELTEEFERATLALTVIMARISEHTQSIGQRFEQRTDEINRLIETQRLANNVGGRQNRERQIKKAKETVNNAATDLEQYAIDMAGDLQTFRLENRAMFESLRGGVAAEEELAESAERLAETKKALKELVQILGKNRETVTGFQTSIARMPGLTTKLKRARKRASAILGELVAELQFSTQAAQDILEKLPNAPQGDA